MMVLKLTFHQLTLTERQWERITEPGTVLSRYICRETRPWRHHKSKHKQIQDYQPPPLEFAVCDKKNTQRGWTILDSRDIEPKEDKTELETLLKNLVNTALCRVS